MSFLVYKSSAGSGKTFTLVKEYLKIALGTKDPMLFSRILAITFTNKAANEMVDRVLETLEELSGVTVPMQKRTADLMSILAGELEISEKELKSRSRNTLKKIIHNYRDFSVGTIDSFVHKIIRSFATEMGLNQQFEVELNTDSVLRRAVDRMLERVGVDKVLTQFIEQYVDAKFDDGKTWKVDEDLYDFAKGLFYSHEWYYLEQAKSINLKTYANKYGESKKSVKAYQNALKKVSAQAVGLALNGLEKNMYAHGGQFVGFFEKIIDGDYTTVPGANVKKLVEDENKKWFAPTKTDASQQDSILARKPQLLAFYHQIRAYRKENEKQYVFDKLLFSNMYRVALLSEVDKEVQKIKQENDLVLISDFTDLVGQITRNEPVPFIYEKLGEKYKHFLFDEFQDTSLMQWHNMLPLVENSLSQLGTSLVVGDAKQSIYRWRGGVVEQFTDLPKVYNPYQDEYVSMREKPLQFAFDHRDPLNTNYRSKANIVKFNNMFFAEAATTLANGVEAYYKDVAQEVRDENSQGLIQFKFYHEKSKEEAKEDIFQDITDLIVEIQEDGYQLKDIAILTKTKKDTPALVEFLSKSFINVISSESLLVNNSNAVKLIVSTLYHLNQPGERFYMSELLIRINEVSTKADFHAQIAEVKTITPDKFKSILLGWGIVLERNEILSLSLYEMVSTILEVYGLHRLKDNRLAAWMDYIYKLSLKSGFGLFDLLDDWSAQESKLSIQTPEDVDAVNVMTIHKSKGLDWPIVILAEGNWSKAHKKHSIWVDIPDKNPIPVAILPHNKELENSVFEPEFQLEEKKVILDNLNALYVAFTRPADRLYVMSHKPNTAFFKELFPIISNLEGEQVGETSYVEIKGKSVLESISYGIKERNEKEDKEQENQPKLIKIKNHKNSAYRKKLKVKKNYIKWLNNAGERDFGTLVHKAFSFVEVESDIPQAIEKLVMQGDIEVGEKAEFQKMLVDVISHPKVAPYFKLGLTVKNEAEIVLQNGELLRPDRVVMDGEETTVIDYKTGMRKPEHDEQILSYKSQLMRMGYKNVNAVLIYTNDVEVVVM